MSLNLPTQSIPWFCGTEPPAPAESRQGQWLCQGRASLGISPEQQLIQLLPLTCPWEDTETSPGGSTAFAAGALGSCISWREELPSPSSSISIAEEKCQVPAGGRAALAG